MNTYRMKSKRNELKVKNSKYIYKDPWLKLRLDELVRSDGFESTYSVAELKGGIGVVVLDKENRITLVGQYRYAPGLYSWEIPKGAFDSFDSKELPLDRAKEELNEETGITARSWKELTLVYTLLGSSNDKVYLFLAQDITSGASHPEQSEIISQKKVTFKEFYEMVERQEIVDATTIAAVGLAEKTLGVK